MTLSELERALLDQPFDLDLRLRYAQALAGAGDDVAAERHAGIVLQQQPSHAATAMLLAQCRFRADDLEAARLHYQRARQGGHASDTALESLLAPRPSGRPQLSVVDADGSTRPVQPETRAVTRFADVAGLEALKQTLRLAIIEPFLNPGLFARFRKKGGGGVMLYGPPGCGKTLMARAVAGECRADFISVGISEVMSMWIGESESQLAALFAKARSQRPCVLFFDELDALAFARSKAANEHSRRVVNEFLNQLDGFANDNDGVLILAATNMPWDVDAAMKRPGRFARSVFVPPPDAAARRAMLEMKLAGVPHEGLDLGAIASDTAQFSGADIDGLIDQAKDLVLAEILSGARERPLRVADFLTARATMVPSTMDWLKTARNLVRYAGGDDGYADVERYLKEHKLLK